jgi:hypothetical protein
MISEMVSESRQLTKGSRQRGRQGIENWLMILAMASEK